MDFIFTPEHIAVTDLFGNDIKYIIPEYQRPYSWDCLGKSNKNNQINTMWNDLFDYFIENQKNNEYFFGSMVLIEKENREFEVIDGQQRLTTLNILFASVKCFLREIKNSKEDIIEYSFNSDKTKFDNFIDTAVQEIDKLLYNIDTWGLMPQKKLKIEKFNGFDYDNVLKLTLECKHKSIIDISNANDEQKTIAFRYFNNRDYFIGKLKEEFLTKNKFTEPKAILLDKFVAFLKKRVSLVRIKTPNFNCAYQIFEILNNRGLPLSNKDLLRNFIIKEFATLKSTNDKYKDIQPAQQWNDLDQNYILDIDFISRWIESKKASQQKYSAFNDLMDIYNDPKNQFYKDDINSPKIVKIYQDISSDLDNYTKIISNLIPNNNIANKIIFLLNAGNQRYTINILLSMLRACPYDENKENILIDFLTEYEKYIIYTYLNHASRFSNSVIYKSIYLLNKNDIEAAKNVFKDFTNEEELVNLIQGDIKDNFDAKLLIYKYLLYIDILCENDVIYQNILFEKATLEHIIPLKPETDSNWTKDFTEEFRKKYTYKLGNMTLLTRTLNSNANNHDFLIKQKDYKKTKLALTHILSYLPQINQEYIENRHKEIINAIYKDLKINN